MLKRKIASQIRDFFKSKDRRMLIVDGTRQVGKSFIVRNVCQELFAHYIEINMEEDKLGDRLFAQVRTKAEFYLALSSVAGNRMGTRDDTLVFIDEIQAYPALLTLAKFLVEEGRFTYVASGSLLGVTLQETQSIPIGSIRRLHMYPLDFEEYLWANGVGVDFINALRQGYENRRPVSQAVHDKITTLFRRYLLTGGLPECVNTFISDNNIYRVRATQSEIHDLYSRDAAKYEQESNRKLKIRRIYDMLPSNLENKKKRIVAKNIEGIKGSRMTNYQDEFDYLVSSGIALEVKAISQPTYPLIQNAGKNLLKLYLNDVGLFTNVLYGTNIRPVLNDMASINLGAVYESVVAQELAAHGHHLYYYDNKQHGEVDYLIDDNNTLSVLPIEVKSGKDYRVHHALDYFLSAEDYPVTRGIVLSNGRDISEHNHIIYLPVYYVMFL